MPVGLVVYTVGVDVKAGPVVWTQPTLPRALWDWRERPVPPARPARPGRRVFTVIDGGGAGDGVPCAQLSLLD